MPPSGMSATKTLASATYLRSAATAPAPVTTQWRMAATKNTTNNNLFRESSATVSSPVAIKWEMTATKTPR